MERLELSTLPKKNNTSTSTDIRKLFIEPLRTDQSIKATVRIPTLLADIYVTRIRL